MSTIEQCVRAQIQAVFAETFSEDIFDYTFWY